MKPFGESQRQFTRRPDWFDDAACRGLTDVFFPASGGNPVSRKAREICAECPCRARCLLRAIDEGERYGIWAGMQTREFGPIRRSRVAMNQLRSRAALEAAGLAS